MIVIIDYGMGNVGSILNMLKRVGATAVISDRPQEVEAATKLVLPGVGAFDTGMRQLAQTGLLEVLNRRVLVDRVPVIGICLGMQLMTLSSEEGDLGGLGWIRGRTVRFRPQGDEIYKIPHMGWNTTTARPGSLLFQGLEKGARFYFVHSYYVVCDREADVAARTQYGCEFVSAVERGNITGTQFHPEKSHRYGMTLLANFVGWNPAC